MKKTRYIPYGYTMREGKTIIEHNEAEIIQHIFLQYIQGASLKDLAMELTNSNVPYTEKTAVWDKARIARIIENAKYTGSDEYDPIIDEDTYENAVSAKSARQRNTIAKECEGITLIRNRIRCSECGSPMVRRICSKRKIKESWTCTNDECGIRVRISDSDLLIKITLLINRIIANSNLMLPRAKHSPPTSPIIAALQKELDAELIREHPSEEFILTKISELAGQLYRETNAKEQIAARIARKRAVLMSPQEEFNCTYFSDIIENVIIDKSGKIAVRTKTDISICEGDEDGGC